MICKITTVCLYLLCRSKYCFKFSVIIVINYYYIRSKLQFVYKIFEFDTYLFSIIGTLNCKYIHIYICLQNNLVIKQIDPC